MKTSELLQLALVLHGPPTTPAQAMSLRQIERLAEDLAEQEQARLRSAGIDALGNDLSPTARRMKPHNYALPEL